MLFASIIIHLPDTRDVHITFVKQRPKLNSLRPSLRNPTTIFLRVLLATLGHEVLQLARLLELQILVSQLQCFLSACSHVNDHGTAAHRDQSRLEGCVT